MKHVHCYLSQSWQVIRCEPGQNTRLLHAHAESTGTMRSPSNPVASGWQLPCMATDSQSAHTGLQVAP
jgi:hypothetical protein